MDFEIDKVSDNTIRIKSARKFTDDELNQLFEQYGEVEKIMSESNSKIIFFLLNEAAERCMKDADRILAAFRSIDFDFDSTGDTACKNDENENFSKIKRLFKQFTLPRSNEIEGDKIPNCNKQITDSSYSRTNGKFIPSCSSPVLLSSADPGFRLAYCHNVTDLHSYENILKNKKRSYFNQSIKKYIIDTAPSVGIQDLMLTNLPANVTREDIYKLCGHIKPTSVELKTTANINALYAYIKLKSKGDFKKLNNALCNCFINGVKITSVPITKIAESKHETLGI